jgi:8-amino-7-oxononanoate synthase
MLDFTSALYLGLRHPSPSLQPWSGLTTGKPAALELPPGSEVSAAAFAVLIGCERATPMPSTLHLFWDLFGLLAREPVRIYMQQGTYAIARWGVERAACGGVPVRQFPHLDAAMLAELIAQDAHTCRRPIVVADGFCPNCGRPSPLPAFLRSVAPAGGFVVLDDTQAIGVLGPQGSGSPRWQGVQAPELIVGSSLAKGFGVPMAMLAGNSRVIRHFEDRSLTRVHCSPPSASAFRAAESALAFNRDHGDGARQRLATLLRRFQAGLRSIGLVADGGAFPLQTLRPAGVAAEIVYQRLLRAGVRTVLMRHCGEFGARVALLITAAHRPAEIDRAVEAIGRCIPLAHSTQQLTGRAS